MVERLNFGRYNYDDEGEEEVDDVDDDVDELDHAAAAEGFDERHELVEHQVDHATVDSGQAGYKVRLGYRANVRRLRKGHYQAPDVTAYQWPTFTPVKDLPIEEDDG